MSDAFDSAPEPGRPEDFPDFDPGPPREPIAVQDELADLTSEEQAEVVRFLELAGVELTQPGCPVCGRFSSEPGTCESVYHDALAVLESTQETGA
jgi:hypothetical protein